MRSSLQRRPSGGSTANRTSRQGAQARTGRDALHGDALTGVPSFPTRGHRERDPASSSRDSVQQQVSQSGDTAAAPAVVQRKEIEEVETAVGLELTFGNAFTKKHLKEGAQLDQTFSNAFEAFVARLSKNMEGALKSTDGELVKCERHPQAKAGIFRGLVPDNQKFLLQSEDGSEKWWFNVSLDPGVVEVQTMPVAGRQFGNTWVGEAVDTLFEQVGLIEFGGQPLAPAKEDGGGHINVDLVGSGIERPAQLVNLMSLWSLVSGELAKEIDLFEVTHTGALLQDARMTRSKHGLSDSEGTSRLMKGLREVSKQKDMAKAKTTLTRLFFNYPQASFVRDDPGFMSERLAKNDSRVSDEMAMALHNQALNAEHVDEEGGRARLEFRNIRAQEGLLEIRKSILICIAVIDASLREGIAVREVEDEIRGIWAPT